jgi:competence protein ComFC
MPNEMPFKTLATLKHILLDILFPPICVGCNAYLPGSRSPLCDTCGSSIIRNTALLCPICKTRLPMNGRTCGHGRKNESRFPYLLGAATRYDDPIAKTIIHACKYEKVHALTDVCARMLVEYADRLDPQPALFAANPIVVPIPLHPNKESKRGFNQSALIAQKFAHDKNFPYAELLVKTINNDPQAKTRSHTERFDRMRDAFAIPDPALVKDKNIILIDDVSTSGATLSEAAQVLKAAGAKQILALVFAKA